MERAKALVVLACSFQFDIVGYHIHYIEPVPLTLQEAFHPS